MALLTLIQGFNARLANRLILRARVRESQKLKVVGSPAWRWIPQSLSPFWNSWQNGLMKKCPSFRSLVVGEERMRPVHSGDILRNLRLCSVPCVFFSALTRLFGGGGQLSGHRLSNRKCTRPINTRVTYPKSSIPKTWREKQEGNRLTQVHLVGVRLLNAGG